MSFIIPPVAKATASQFSSQPLGIDQMDNHLVQDLASDASDGRVPAVNDRADPLPLIDMPTRAHQPRTPAEATAALEATWSKFLQDHSLRMDGIGAEYKQNMTILGSSMQTMWSTFLSDQDRQQAAIRERLTENYEALEAKLLTSVMGALASLRDSQQDPVLQEMPADDLPGLATLQASVDRLAQSLQVSGNDMETHTDPSLPIQALLNSSTSMFSTLQSRLDRVDAILVQMDNHLGHPELHHLASSSHELLANTFTRMQGIETLLVAQGPAQVAASTFETFGPTLVAIEHRLANIEAYLQQSFAQQIQMKAPKLDVDEELEQAIVQMTVDDEPVHELGAAARQMLDSWLKRAPDTQQKVRLRFHSYSC